MSTTIASVTDHIGFLRLELRPGDEFAIVSSNCHGVAVDKFTFHGFSEEVFEGVRVSGPFVEGERVIRIRDYYPHVVNIVRSWGTADSIVAGYQGMRRMFTVNFDRARCSLISSVARAH